MQVRKATWRKGCAQTRWVAHSAPRHPVARLQWTVGGGDKEKRRTGLVNACATHHMNSCIRHWFRQTSDIRHWQSDSGQTITGSS